MARLISEGTDACEQFTDDFGCMADKTKLESEGTDDCEKFTDDFDCKFQIPNLKCKESNDCDEFLDDLDFNSQEYIDLESKFIVKESTYHIKSITPYPTVDKVVSKTDHVLILAHEFLLDITINGALTDRQALNVAFSCFPTLAGQVKKLVYGKDHLAIDKNKVEVLNKFYGGELGLVKTPGDGSCFYNAVSFILFGTFDYSDIIRVANICALHSYWNRVQSYLQEMAIDSILSLSISNKVAHQLNLPMTESFCSDACPLLLSAALGRPLVIISNNGPGLDRGLKYSAFEEMRFKSPMFIHFSSIVEAPHYSALVKIGTCEGIEVTEVEDHF